MSAVRPVARGEEGAQLSDLRDQAERSTAAAAQILAELTRRANAARRPGEAARRLGTDVRAAAVRALREGPGWIAGQRGAKRLTLAAVPVLVVVAAVAYAATHGRPQQQQPTGPFKRIFPDKREISVGGSR